MSLRALAWAWTVDDDLEEGHRLLLVGLAQASDDQDRCVIPIADLVRITRKSRETVMRRLAELRRRGLIRSEARLDALGRARAEPDHTSVQPTFPCFSGA